jgi:hypothetical protein
VRRRSFTLDECIRCNITCPFVVAQCRNQNITSKTAEEQSLCVGDQHGNNRDSSVSDALVSTPIHPPPIHAYKQKKPPH